MTYNTQIKPKVFQTAYDAGFDAGYNGPDNINSHFKWFLSKISMQDWERGKRAAEAKNPTKNNKQL